MANRWNQLKRPLCNLISRSLLKETKKEVVVLMYHGISEEPICTWGPEKYDITSKEFKSQLTLLSHRFNSISMDQLSMWLQGKEDIPDRAFVITFDDALQNQFINALPVLESLNIPATVYVPTAAIDDRFPVFDRLLAKKIKLLDVENPSELYWKLYYSLRHESSELQMAVVDNLSNDNCSMIHMTQGQLQKLADHHLFSLGGHSHAHKHLTEYADEELEEDLSESKRIFKERIQVNIKHFSYPYGDFNEDVRKSVTAHGFDTAVKTHPRIVEFRRCENRYAIPRIDGATQFEEWFGDSI